MVKPAENFHRFGVNLNRLFVLIIALSTLLLLTGCSDFVDHDQESVVPEAAIVLEPGHTVGQTFVARHGIGGSWAQDPPHYAEVVAFETSPEWDWAHIWLVDWRGWQHSRWIYFYYNRGPIVIVDEARGPAGAKAELVWHFLTLTK